MRVFTWTIPNMLGGMPRFTKSVMLVDISIGTCSYKQYVQAALLQSAHHTNVRVCAKVIAVTCANTWASISKAYG